MKNLHLNLITLSILTTTNVLAQENLPVNKSPVGNSSNTKIESTKIENTMTTQDENKIIEKIEVRGSYVEGYGASDVSGASRLDLSAIEIPQSVSVISNAQMKDFQLTDINAALDTATGINVERIETDRTYYTARGFDVTNFQIDGVGLPLTNGNNHADEDTAIYDRVEVIRGANGLMTGVGNPSATINFIRKRPTAQTEVNVSGTVGSWNKKRLEVDASTPITDNISARVVVVKQKNDSYLDRYQQDKSVAYGFLDFQLTDDTSVSISHSYNNSEATGNNWGANPLYYTDGSATNYETSTNTSANWSNWQVVKNNTVIELDHNFNNNWSLRATYSRKRTDEDTELFYVYGTPDKATELGLTGYGSEYDLDDKNELFDAYINGDFSLFGREHQIVAGFNFSEVSYQDKSLYDYTTGNGFPAMPPLPTWDGNATKPTFTDGLTGSDVTNTQKAAYFTGRFELLDNLHVIAGGRYNDWQVQGTSYDIVQDADDQEFIPYLGAVYQITPELMGYASYTETFMSQTELDINDEVLAPITGESKELGLKSEFFNGLLIGSIAYFDIDQKNLALAIDQNPDPAAQRYIGADGLNSKGYELEVAGQVSTNLQLSFGFTDFKISGNQAVEEFKLQGEIVADYTPSTLLKLAANYNVAAIEGLSLGINMNWQDATSRKQGFVGEEQPNAGQEIVTNQDAYAIVNLMVGYDITKQIKLSLNANNVTDEKYINSLYWAQGYYGAPANYSATISWAL